MTTHSITIDEFRKQLDLYRASAPRAPKDDRRIAARRLLAHLSDAQRRNEVALAEAIEAAIDRHNLEMPKIAIHTLYGA